MRYDANVHHRQSIRLPAYGYGSVGAYFVTICSYRRECIFDDPALRATAEYVWRKVATASGPADEFVVMPNHVHGIIWITEARVVGARQRLRSLRSSESRRTMPSCGRPVSLPRPYAPPPGSLGSIVGSFKSATAKRINNMRGTPGGPVWQRNYYERVIRNGQELLAIQQYILNNPRNWANDPNHPGNLR